MVKNSKFLGKQMPIQGGLADRDDACITGRQGKREGGVMNQFFLQLESTSRNFPKDWAGEKSLLGHNHYETRSPVKK